MYALKVLLLALRGVLKVLFQITLFLLLSSEFKLKVSSDPIIFISILFHEQLLNVLNMIGHGLGSRVGAVVRGLASHQCVPGSIPGPGVICGLSLLLVLYSAPRGFLRVLRFSHFSHEPLARVIVQALPALDVKFTFTFTFTFTLDIYVKQLLVICMKIDVQ